MRLREQWIRPLDALPQDYQHVIAITSSGQEEEMYLVDDKWHIVDGVRIPIEFVVFWHEKREQSTLEMAEDCISREQAVYVASGYCAPQNIADELRKLPSATPQPKRGKWIFNENMHDYCCSECGCLMPSVNGRILDNQSKHDEAIHAQGFVDGVKACIEKLNEMGADK